MLRQLDADLLHGVDARVRHAVDDYSGNLATALKT